MALSNSLHPGGRTSLTTISRKRWSACGSGGRSDQQQACLEVSRDGHPLVYHFKGSEVPFRFTLCKHLPSRLERPLWPIAGVCTENLIQVDAMRESPKLTRWLRFYALCLRSWPEAENAALRHQLIILSRLTMLRATRAAKKFASDTTRQLPFRSGPWRAWIKVKNPKAPAATRAIDEAF
jgi:hypothetical protein